MLKKVLLEFFVTDNEIFTFIVRPKLPELEMNDEEPIVVRAALGSEDIQQAIREIKEDFKSIKTNNIEITDCDLTNFYNIGEQIFTEELMAYIEAFDAIYFVPFGSLHYLPLHAMKFKGKHLIDLFQIAYLPSASVLEYIQHSEVCNIEKSILLGGVDSTSETPNFIWESDQIDQLPFWEGQNKIYLKGQTCTKENFVAHCQEKKYIHLSSHGHFSEKDPLNSGLILAGDFSDSFVDGFDLLDDDYQFLLTARSIFEEVQLKTDLFVLSACVTGDSEYKAGDELIGLTRALMYAGAKSMIVTLFPTIKNVTSSRRYPELQFARFYELLIEKELSKGAAFQKYIQTIKNHSSYNHPYYWMPFILVGNLN